MKRCTSVRSSAREQLETISSYVEIGKQEGATTRRGGRRRDRGRTRQGFFHEPTIFDRCRPGMRIANEEIFGPVTSVVPVDRLDEAIDVANSVEYGLSASIFTQDINNAYRAMRDIFTGILYVNAGTTGAEIHLPFGGTKAHRQRPPRSGHGHARLLYRVAKRVCRLQRQAAAGADR